MAATGWVEEARRLWAAVYCTTSPGPTMASAIGTAAIRWRSSRISEGARAPRSRWGDGRGLRDDSDRRRPALQPKEFDRTHPRWRLTSLKDADGLDRSASAISTPVISAIPRREGMVDFAESLFATTGGGFRSATSTSRGSGRRRPECWKPQQSAGAGPAEYGRGYCLRLRESGTSSPSAVARSIWCSCSWRRISRMSSAMPCSSSASHSLIRLRYRGRCRSRFEIEPQHVGPFSEISAGSALRGRHAAQIVDVLGDLRRVLQLLRGVKLELVGDVHVLGAFERCR